MFPNPIDTFCSFVTEVTTVEISAKEQYELNAFTIRSVQLVHLCGFFFSSLVYVGEVTGRLSLNEYRKLFCLCSLRHHNHIDRDVDLLGSARLFHGNIQPKREGGWFHFVRFFY